MHETDQFERLRKWNQSEHRINSVDLSPRSSKLFDRFLVTFLIICLSMIATQVSASLKASKPAIRTIVKKSL